MVENRYMRIYLTPTPFPVSFGPNEADWWMVAMTGIAAVASIAIAIVAFSTASGARRISSETEAQREATDRRKEALEYAHRLDDAIVRLFQSIGEHFGSLRKWMGEAEEVEIHSRTDSFGDLLYPEHPDMDSIDSHAEAVRMIARNVDADIAREAAYSIALTHNVSGRERWIDLKAIMQAIRQWRSGEISSEGTLRFLKEFQEAKGPK